jgi:GTP-binding protein
MAGKGGAGAVAFYREKYIPKGGPDGGDGGKGGDVYFEANYNFHNLSHLYKDRIYKGGVGEQGRGQNKHGKNGDDLTVNVPPGTEIIDEDGAVIADLVNSGDRVMICAGGIGGRGNAFFKTSTNRTPRFAQPGMPGDDRIIILNLKLIADVGLVGLPNSGKSTLLSKLTNARPKVADYPFTTLIPNLGVVEREDGTVYKIADIPGIIEGAHMGHGLGLSFLRHIERVRIILYLIDITLEDINYNFDLLKSELREYNTNLIEKPYYILLTKSDLADEETTADRMNTMKDHNVLPISSLNSMNIDELYNIIDKLMGSECAAK